MKPRMIQIRYTDSLGADRSLDLLLGKSGITTKTKAVRTQSFGMGGSAQTFLKHFRRDVEVELHVPVDIDTMNMVDMFITHAQVGYTFSLAKYPEKAGVFAIDSVGTDDIYLTEPSPYEPGDSITLWDKNKLFSQSLTIKATDGNHIELNAGIQADFASSGTLCHSDYYDKLVLTDDTVTPKNKGGYHIVDLEAVMVI